MHPANLYSLNPLQVASHSERLAKDKIGTRIGLAFSGITAISLGAMATKTLTETVRDLRRQTIKESVER